MCVLFIGRGLIRILSNSLTAGALEYYYEAIYCLMQGIFYCEEVGLVRPLPCVIVNLYLTESKDHSRS